MLGLLPGSSWGPQRPAAGTRANGAWGLVFADWLNNGGANYSLDAVAGLQGNLTAITRGPGGLLLDGATSYINLGAAARLKFNRSFTVLIAFRPPNVSQTAGLIGHGASDWYFRQNSNQLEVLSSQTASILTAGVIAANQDYVAGFTVSGETTATVRLWLNGLQVGTTTTAQTFNTGSQPAYIGADSNGGPAEFYAGMINWALVANREWRGPEIWAVSRYPGAVAAPPALRQRLLHAAAAMTTDPTIRYMPWLVR